MSTVSTDWYIRGQDNKPLGPFTSEKLVESWHTKRLDPNTLCWQEGMADWLPLAVVEPFASTMRAERWSAQRRMFRLVAVGLLAIAVLAAVAGTGYFWWTESAIVARAKQLIAADQYEEASAVLEPLAKQSRFFRRRAAYLLALGLVKQFASATKAEDASDDLLADAKKQFGELFEAAPKWREEAKADLASIIGAVPSHVPGSLKRCSQLADLLSDVQLADSKELANGLLSKAKAVWADPQRGLEQDDGEAVAWIVNGNAALVDDVLAAIISDTTSVEAIDQRLASVQQWVRGRPALAQLFEPGLAERANKLAIAGQFEKSHRLVATAKRIDSTFDTWGFWERYFQTADSKSSPDAIAILTFMVEGEQNPERLERAAALYSDLRKRHADVATTPPPEIRDVADTARLSELIAEVEQFVKNGQYQNARTKLDDARGRFSSVWSRVADADRLDREVRFQLDCETARRSFGTGDLATALASVKDALQVRPDDKEAAVLRDNIQTAIDKAEVEQHRRDVEKAIVTEDFHGAVDEILKAREILEKPANISWGTPIRGVLDELAKTVIGNLHVQATGLSEKRRYEEAETVVTLGERLSPKDEKLTELLAKIKGLEADPKSANISGTWLCSEDGNVLEMTLKDTGADLVAWRLSEARGGRQITGSFTRREAALEDTRPFEMRGVPGQLAVKARIDAPDTIVVQRSEFKPSNARLAPRIDNTKHTWTRRAAGETGTPDTDNRPVVRPPVQGTPPRQHRKTPPHPFTGRQYPQPPLSQGPDFRHFTFSSHYLT